MEKAIAIFAAANFAIIGLSHAFQHAAWREFFALLHSHGRAGAFFNGMMTLLMGSLIVAFHNIWLGPRILLTLIGWGYLAKSALIFLLPEWSVRSMASVNTASKLKFFFAGLGLFSFSLVILLTIFLGCYD